METTKLVQTDLTNPAQDSSSSAGMDRSDRSDPTFELGKKLVEELGPYDSRDTLTRWMTHYIAELMKNAESANLEDRPARRSKCAEAILDLWKHRHELPNGSRPLREFEPLLCVLESLHPAASPRYRHSVQLDDNNAEVDSAQNPWLSQLMRLIARHGS